MDGRQEGSNEHYLQAAVGWLRLRLSWHAAQYENPAAGPETVQQDQLRLAEAVAAAERVDPPPALTVLSQRLGLTPFERQVLLLCAAVELDTRIPALCAAAQDNPHRPFPTFALAMALFDDPAWDALSPERPLRYWRLIEIGRRDGVPLTVGPLQADERVVGYLKGLDYLEDRLTALVAPLDSRSPFSHLPPSQQALAERIAGQLQQTDAGGTSVIQLLGADEASKRLIAGRAADLLGLDLYHLPSLLLPRPAADLELLARLWHRESLLNRVALYLDAGEDDPEGSAAGPAGPLHRFLARSGGVTFLATRDLRTDLARPTVALDAAKPTRGEQQATWSALLDQAAPQAAGLLAGQFDLNVATIQEIARHTLAQTAPNDGRELGEQLWDACLAFTRPRLDLLAQRLVPQATWSDIVLPPDETTLLHQIADQVRQRSQVYEEWGFHHKMNRGFGISALFAGESGTGKTMAAEVVANDLRLNLYRIDLSGVVSKYVGETEKNLRRLFDAAEDGGAILFFDEADALFGKRSQVSDSHDRYANIEINYLLQRMEAFRGLAILATNRKSDLDEAFTRRLRFIVNFPLPKEDDRRCIWQLVFPAQTPLTDLDLDRLARFNLTGGSIHNVALNAAFLGARSASAVTMPLVLQAVRTEFLKIDRLIKESDFR